MPGLELVREDLGIKYPKRRRKKDSSIVFGQKHGAHKENPGVTTPGDGQGDFPQSEVPIRNEAKGSRP
ncbi:MAG: hypothetical protein R3321_14825 [Nitrososphaeraceae archaeon]|nr:hypothetical protein [Nitrososphaeraceae archaeon]